MLCESRGRPYQGELGCQFLYVAACAPLTEIKGMFQGPPTATLAPTIAAAYECRIDIIHSSFCIAFHCLRCERIISPTVHSAVPNPLTLFSTQRWSLTAAI